MKYIDHINFIMTRDGVSCEELASRTGIGRNTMIGYLKQISSPTTASAKRMAEVLGYDLVIRKKNENGDILLERDITDFATCLNECGLSRAELREMFHMSEGGIRSCITGRTIPKIDRLTGFLNRLGYSAALKKKMI